MNDWDVRVGVVIGLVLSAAILIGLLLIKSYESRAEIRSVQGPVLPVAQRSCRPTNEQPRLCTAPEKTAETPVLPTSPDAAAVKKDDDHLTKQLINGFFSPAAPGGIGGE